MQAVERFDANVKVTRGIETVGGTSIMGLMMLAAATGTTIKVEASGSEAGEAIDALTKLVERGFGEEDYRPDALVCGEPVFSLRRVALYAAHRGERP